MLPAIHLVRHGETLWNAAGRYQGALDSPLTERGREQARAVGRLLARLADGQPPLPAAVSPLGRTRETAALIAEACPLDIALEPRLAEVSVGSWDGLTDYEIEAEYPGALDGANAFDWFFRSPDGEGFEAAAARISSWLSEASGPVAAVTHGLASRIVRGLYLGLGREAMLALQAPQDGLFVLHAGAAEWVAADH